MKQFEMELNFTDTYKRFQFDHIAIREAMCLKEQFPAVFTDMQRGDLFAGRINYGLFGFGLEESSGGVAGYGLCGLYSDLICKIEQADIDAQRREQILEAIRFWNDEESITTKHHKAMPEGHYPDGTRLAGVYLDYDKLVRLGLPGLIEEIKKNQEAGMAEGKDGKFHEGLLLAMELFTDVCLAYSAHAKMLSETADDENWKQELVAASQVLRRITVEKPKTLREAIQLFWLYALISGVVNYGRLDVFLGDFYARDIDSGLLTEDQALSQLKSLWKLVADRKIVFNGRIIIGGKGRRNEKNADRFALAAMEATRLVQETEPQLTLRFYKGMNPLLMERALDVIGVGRIYPIFYNDDVNVPAVQKAFGICLEDAEQYLPYGCGEYAIDHKSLNSPNSGFNLLKTLEYTLHNGKDGMTGKQAGLQTGEFTSFGTFDELYEAYKRQAEYELGDMPLSQVIEYKVERENACYLFVSALFGDCVEKGKSIVDGGACYLGGMSESFGIVNAGDSLAAIKQLVYDKKLFTQEQVLAMLDANFVGYEKEWKLFLDAPKYGNDDDFVDDIVRQVSDHACKLAIEAGKKLGMDFYLIVNINNFWNVISGRRTAASTDGRRAGEPLANGNTPTAGRDKKGITAFLNSIAKIDPTLHAGYVHNMKFTRRMFTEDRAKLKSLLDGYFANGGTQAMITVVNRGDLEQAMIEPDKYRNLIVRVGGFSARFIELDRDVQRDILNRTLY